MFHVSEGLYFEKVPWDSGYGVGAVRIIKRASGMPDAPLIFETILMANEWASVVSSMTSLGETGTTWAMMMVLQQGGFCYDSALKKRPLTAQPMKDQV